MKKLVLGILSTTMLLLSGCRSEKIQYSQALFNHIPDEPELLVLVRPNDISKLAEVAIEELKLQEFFDEKLKIDAKALAHYQNITVQMLEALGIPWPQVESVGFLLYFEKPVLLVAGGFTKTEVSEKLRSLGFNDNSNGFFNYIYNDLKLNVPADGLMILATETLLEDLSFIPEDRRLWNRPDFKEYRMTSPLNNSLFIWTHPPENFLSDFKYREELGDISFAVNFRNNITFKSTINVKDPQKAVYLSDILIGIFTTSSGLLGDDPDYGPIFKGIQVKHDQQRVETSLVISQNQVASLKKRIIDDIQNPEASAFDQLQTFFEKFK